MSSTPPSEDASPARDQSFQQLADGAPVMIWMSGLDMGCFYFNHAWLDFRGRTLAQEAGNGWAEGVHPQDVQRCVNHYVGCFERRVAFAMTYRLQDRNGQYLWLLDRGAPHYRADGTFLGFYGGCAEIERQTPLLRATQLRACLTEMSEFARDLATIEAAGAGIETTDRDLRHAAKQLEQLAADMLELDQLPRGACVP
jgi:PAS domain S-box-containing protein